MALVRRVARKSDFLRYATYEMDLERLRRKRAEKISECGPCGSGAQAIDGNGPLIRYLGFTEERSPQSVSDYGIVKRVFQIFERAVRKFKGDIGLWMEYIRIAEKVGAKALAGKIAARWVLITKERKAIYCSHQGRFKCIPPRAGCTLCQQTER